MKIKVAECFYSLQGEGRYMGVPSIFTRMFGCNFSCGGFGMPRGEKSQERFAIDAESITDYKNVPLVKTGCDSFPSWDPRFKHLSKHYTIDQLCALITGLLPRPELSYLSTIRFEQSSNNVHLVLTGGEPLLGWQKMYVELLSKLQVGWLNFLTFETNGTQKLIPTLSEYLRLGGLKVTFSVSPKLSDSGETWEDAIKPEVVATYQDTCPDPEDLYFKFVVDSVDHVAEVKKAMREYNDAGVYGPVYLMPVGGTGDLYFKNNQLVAKMAMDNGWRYSQRLQVDLWKNAWGT